MESSILQRRKRSHWSFTFTFWARCLLSSLRLFTFVEDTNGLEGGKIYVFGVVDEMSILLGHRHHLRMDVDYIRLWALAVCITINFGGSDCTSTSTNEV